MKTHYFFYLVLMDMLINIMVYVPDILFEDRFNGAIMSMLLTIPLSTTLAYLLSIGLMKFPGMGLPEIFKLTFPVWIRTPVLIYLGINWSIGVWIALTNFAILAKRYINPDLSLVAVLLFFLAVVGWGAVQNSRTVLYVTEIITLLNVPLIFFIMIKAFTSSYMRWKEIFSMGAFAFNWPTWSSLSAATYLFNGYIEMVILHREFEGKFTTKYHWIIPIMGLLSFITTFAVPIGFHGLMAVGDYPYPWVVTADSMRFKLGFVERVVFVFLLLYIGISIMYGIVAWHNSIELLKGAFEKTIKGQWQRYFPWILLALLAIPPCYAVELIDQPKLLQFSRLWLNSRLAGEIALVLTVYLLGRWRKTA
ncbi:hypothetical protein O9H85_32930 [Paenibacillus filicis]|uniref:GerAB/ArcD/ProY family transporter n=1 Tax=Paenibacillus gyeongsangnamensis TaxID=3388067 RepID=A0ABT4QJV8_9BACL|nr:hypothetical protein [Paenibacillus filicis]MCZ8517072.1 hypothetical protein [Paenibacillus filicis]